MRSDSDDHLVRYLLGDLPDDEAERLDERSITDEAFALRLRVLENDLIDGYARGAPLDAALERFDGMYHTAPYLREKVRFAQALSSLTAKAESGRTPARIGPAPSRPAWRSLATAAVLLVSAAGYLGVHNTRLRDEVQHLEARRAAVERQNATLQQQLERTRATPPRQPLPLTATFLLRAPRRGLGNDTSTIAVPRGTEQVALRLQVESDEHAVFWASLRDPATTRIVWRSPDLAAENSGSDRIVTLTIPAGSLLAQRYSVELSGVARSGSSELLGHYPVRVVLE